MRALRGELAPHMAWCAGSSCINYCGRTGRGFPHQRLTPVNWRVMDAALARQTDATSHAGGAANQRTRGSRGLAAWKARSAIQPIEQTYCPIRGPYCAITVLGLALNSAFYGQMQLNRYGRCFPQMSGTNPHICSRSRKSSGSSFTRGRLARISQACRGGSTEEFLVPPGPNIPV